MKRLTFTLLGFILAVNIIAQGSWEMISPRPTINDLHNVFFVNEQTGWAVGMKGTIIATKDGGQTWDLQYEAQQRYFTGVYFINENEGWVVGWHDVLHTQDGGETWEMQNVPGFLDLEKIQFINSDTGWIVGTYNRIYKTIDGGETWTMKLTGGTDSPAFNDLFFTDALHGVAVGGDWFSYEDDAYILVTTDGGENWVETTPDNTNELLSVTFVSPDTGWACGYGNKVLKTVDGGFTWQSIATSMYGSMHDVHFFYENHGVILSNSDVFVSNDGGVNWTQIQTGMSSNVDVFSFYGSTGFCVGYYGYIYKSENYGEDWVPLGSQRFGTIERITFLDTLSGWGKAVIGPRLVHTTDGGLSWENVDIGSSQYFIDLCFPTTTTGYAINNNYLFKTTDAGTTWQQNSIGFAGQFIRLYFVNEQLGFIGGYNGLLLRTEDGGQSWTQQNLSVNDRINDIQFVDNQKGWLIGHTGNVFKTEDGGLSWVQVEIGSPGSLYDLYFLNDQTGFIASLTGKLFMTDDGGYSWEQVLSYSQSTNRVVINFVDETEGWLAVQGALYYTVDGGYNWLYMGGMGYITDICFLNSNSGWISGSHSMILKYNNQITSIYDSGVQTFKIYPNPAGEKVTLSLPDVKEKHTLLNIYNINGQLIRSFNMNNLSGNINIDISDLITGLYVFELKTPSGSMTVKVLKK